jgi:hypothetical protein
VVLLLLGLNTFQTEGWRKPNFLFFRVFSSSRLGSCLKEFESTFWSCSKENNCIHRFFPNPIKEWSSKDFFSWINPARFFSPEIYTHLAVVQVSPGEPGEDSNPSCESSSQTFKIAFKQSTHRKTPPTFQWPSYWRIFLQTPEF